MEKHNLKHLGDGIVESWKSFNISQVNSNNVRFRVMENVTASWHSHSTSDELFYVISGTVHIDTEDGTHTLSANELLIVPAKTKHRARVEGKATLLVIDKIE
ncbi:MULTISPECIES: cupin domain-containing protein [Nostocales]|uniref:Cupin domain-containing protein n=2 Tax=Nostocales TaxID=1161 RepID=A0A8S9T3G6_9CYAN|nr:cupin domain-containing protein [Tolypothrix bouteillei]KAF3886497.1 cupin domain-containing protein [Tolypothrix bouteillei VB521301]